MRWMEKSPHFTYSFNDHCPEELINYKVRRTFLGLYACVGGALDSLLWRHWVCECLVKRHPIPWRRSLHSASTLYTLSQWYKCHFLCALGHPTIAFPIHQDPSVMVVPQHWHHLQLQHLSRNFEFAEKTELRLPKSRHYCSCQPCYCVFF